MPPMRKFTYFERFDGEGWPDPRELKPYFFAPPGQEWFNHFGNDTAGIWAEGLDGTEDRIPYKSRVDLTLDLYGMPGLGVLLIYHKYGGGFSEAYTSKGDERTQGVGAQSAQRSAAGRPVRPVQECVARGEGIHRDRRRAAEEHRMGRQQGPARRHLPRSRIAAPRGAKMKKPRTGGTGLLRVFLLAGTHFGREKNPQK